MNKYVMAFDAGTTSSRCIIFDRSGSVMAVAQKEFKQYYPKAGWVEHDPVEIWNTQLGVARDAMKKAGLKAEDICGIGITNQRETTIVWDRETGKPIYNAIVWQCRRTTKICKKLEKQGYWSMITEKTGLKLDAYFSATKVKWILDNVEGAKEKASAGKLCFGTVDSWLIWNLTGGKVHVTDYTNASRTMLFNIKNLCWDKEILDLLDIPQSMLPEVRSSSEVYGETLPEFFGAPIKIAGDAGDQQSSLFGQACFEKGDTKNTYGTGGFLLMNTGDTPIESRNGLVSTIACSLNGKITYALEGSIFVAGAAIQWLRDEMGLIKTAPESEEHALKVENTNGVYMVPAFVGLGAPYWDPNARGAIVGITRGVNADHIIRAALESMAYQTWDVIRAMEADCETRISCLKVDGGACANNFLMQFQSDIIGTEVRRPQCIETTALGAAYLAGLATGYWESIEDIKANWAVDRIFTPEMSPADAEVKLIGWHQAVKSTMDH